MGIELLNGRVRLDTRLVTDGTFSTREKAKRNILAGVVYVNGKKETKPARIVDDECSITVTGDIDRFVSRGGLKLQKAIEYFDIALEGKNVIDIGASTGGFTDCMLQYGALHVTAVDSGTGQLDERLRGNPAVTSLEKTNARYLSSDDIGYIADFISVDVSFISIAKIIPAVNSLLKERGEAVCLIKPQFEAGRNNLGKNGVVREPRVHISVIENIVSLAGSYSFRVNGITYSPVKGPEGNIEYLIYLTKTDSFCNDKFDKGHIEAIVLSAFKELNQR